ncbi:unnamed protein product [Prunus armeniaca]
MNIQGSFLEYIAAAVLQEKFRFIWPEEGLDGLWFDGDSSLWMMPCMNVELANSLSKRGIFSIQQLFPKATLQTMIENFPASKMYQVQTSKIVDTWLTHDSNRMEEIKSKLEEASGLPNCCGAI